MAWRADFSPRAKALLRDPWRQAAALLLAAQFVVNVYRAATQSITHDEGLSYEWFLSGPWSQVISYPHGNHHVLAELISKFAISIAGVSELTLRVPALIGSGLSFYAVFRLCALLLASGPAMLAAVACLSLNPLVLDYLCCSRGYGLPLGLLFYALWHVAQYLDDWAGQRSLWRAGIALGLALGSNPVMVFPAAALTAALALLIMVDAWRTRPAPDTTKPKRAKLRSSEGPTMLRARWLRAAVEFVFPAIAIGGFISLMPHQLIELEEGYLGPPSLLAIAEGLTRYSLFHSPAGFGGLLGWAGEEQAARIFARFVIPAALLIVIAGAIAAARTMPKLSLAQRLSLLLGVALPLNALLIVASRYLFQQPYPEFRTAMYWLPLLTLAVAALGRQWRTTAVTILFALGSVQYLTQFNTRYFAEWQYCAAGKDMMAIVRAHRPTAAGQRVRVGATWQLEPVLNFYIAAWQLDWVEPVERESPDGHFDFYALAYDDKKLVDRLQLKTLLNDRLSGTVLAAPATVSADGSRHPR